MHENYSLWYYGLMSAALVLLLTVLLLANLHRAFRAVPADDRQSPPPRWQRLWMRLIRTGIGASLFLTVLLAVTYSLDLMGKIKLK